MSVILRLIRGKWREFAGMAFFSVLGSMLAIVPYLLIYEIIRRFVADGREVDLAALTTLLAWAVAAIVVRYCFVVTSFVFSHIAAFDLLYQIRTDLTGHLGKLPLGFWSGNSSGRIRKIIQEDVERIELFVAHHMPDMVAGTVLPLATITVLFCIDWRLAAAALAPLPIGFLMMKMMYGGTATGGRNRRELWAQYHKSIEAMHSTIVEYVRGMPVVKTFGIDVASFRRLRDAVWGYRSLTVMLSKTQTPFYVIFTAIVIGGGIFILPVAYYLLRAGLTDVATVLLFLVLGTGCFCEFARVMMIAGHCEPIFAAGERIGAVLAEKELPEPERPERPVSHEIEFRNVSFRYAPEAPEAIKNVSAKLPQSSFTAIVGASGSGKSTLVNLVARMWDVDKGSIAIGGKDIRAVGTAELNKLVGTVFQEVQMLTDTVAANIRMNRADAAPEEIRRAAQTACCDDFIMKLPRGYDTIIGDGGEVHLSGGEQQRIAIARVVLKNPPIILLDEASCYADAENEIHIQQAFSRVMKDRTVVVIAHRLSTIVGADRILVVDGGEIVEQGRHEELLEAGGVYRRMWRAHRRAGAWKLNEMEI